MDANYDVSALNESKNEWTARLINVLTPQIIYGFKSILNESIKTCSSRRENDKYLMTFQNLLVAVPAWNNEIITNERKRICDKSGCVYLEDLVTCVHIIQLKILSAMRVGQKQKKIEIPVPKLDDFIHKVYIHSARQLYTSVYLFEHSVPPLQVQRNNRELELKIQECIMNAVRESIPVESLLKSYLNDETVEEDVVQHVTEQFIDVPVETSPIIIETNPIQNQINNPIIETNPIQNTINNPIIETNPLQNQINNPIIETPIINKTSAVQFSNDTIDYNLKIEPTILDEDLNLIDLDELDNEMKLDIVDLDSSFPELHE
jgi:hypothetical protein